MTYRSHAKSLLAHGVPTNDYLLWGWHNPWTISTPGQVQCPKSFGKTILFAQLGCVKQKIVPKSYTFKTCTEQDPTSSSKELPRAGLIWWSKRLFINKAITSVRYVGYGIGSLWSKWRTCLRTHCNNHVRFCVKRTHSSTFPLVTVQSGSTCNTSTYLYLESAWFESRLGQQLTDFHCLPQHSQMNALKRGQEHFLPHPF
jgi:hypothetical protein